MERDVELYELRRGEIIFKVDKTAETIWATQDQLAELFGVDRTVISRHLRNIYNTEELSQDRTCKEILQVQKEGNREVQRKVKTYNLDAIISVGYRVNSKKATDFRIWATKTLREYLDKGIIVNKDRLKQLEDSKKLKDVETTLGIVRRLLARQTLNQGEATGILEVISKYAPSFQMLEEFDAGHIDLSALNTHSIAKSKPLTREMALTLVENLKVQVKGGELFGKPRNENFDAALTIIDQSYDGNDLYQTVPEKAAHLLYFVIKDHPFYDGNKRIGALFFIVYLTLNNCHLTRNGETKISDRALTALALLIAESEPSEKDLIVSLVQKLLEN